MKHYLKYVAAPMAVAIWSLVAALPAQAGTPMEVWFGSGCEGSGYDWYGNPPPPAWVGSYRVQGSSICYENNSPGFLDRFLQCANDGRASASAWDHVACAFMGIVVTGAVASSVVGTGGAAASGWVAALGLLGGAAAGVSYGALCYCVLHS